MNVLTVSSLNFYVKSVLDEDKNLKSLFIEGEISNLSGAYRTGHLYFSLKDSKSIIKAVMFSTSALHLKFIPKDGMTVIARAKVTLYEPTGQYQLIVEDMQPSGAGALAIAFEQLKEKLLECGLFDEDHKKPIPKTPSVIGVITSENGAAFSDICNVVSRRYPLCEIILYNSIVQGEKAPKMLIQGIRYFQKNPPDVLIIGRGGGSAEDLWAFNDEELAFEIYNCDIPIISAVGHEIDYTICDFVADMRAPTPSAAAEIATPEIVDINNNIRDLSFNIQYSINRMYKEKFDLISKYLSYFTAKNLTEYFNFYLLRVDYLSEKIKNKINRQILLKENESNFLSNKIKILNPESILGKGYSIISKDNKTIKRVKDVNINDKLNIKVSDGIINCVVTDLNSR